MKKVYYLCLTASLFVFSCASHSYLPEISTPTQVQSVLIKESEKLRKESKILLITSNYGLVNFRYISHEKNRKFH